MKEKVLMVILDGFSSNYLKREHCPNLYDISREHYFSKLEPMFGFQGVGAAIYSGASPNVTGVFTEFILKRNEVVGRSRLFQGLLGLTDVIPNERLCADVRYILFRMLGMSRPGISNVIPSKLLTYFSPKLTKEFTEENSLGYVPTIFDILRANSMSYQYRMPAARSESALVSNIISRIRKREMPHFAVIHLCSLDSVGHKFGPYSSHVARAVERMDRQLCKIIRSVSSSPEKMVMIVLSDHGMSPVSHVIDLLETLGKLPLKLGKDYYVFLDSTMARLWFLDEATEKLIFEILASLECGRILNKYDLEKLRIDKLGREYGDLIFALKEGYTIFPDFFRKYHPPKGMHGYAFPSHDTPILTICDPSSSANFKRKEVVRFTDITPTVLELFDLPIPPTCEGSSLLK